MSRLRHPSPLNRLLNTLVHTLLHSRYTMAIQLTFEKLYNFSRLVLSDLSWNFSLEFLIFSYNCTWAIAQFLMKAVVKTSSSRRHSRHLGQQDTLMTWQVHRWSRSDLKWLRLPKCPTSFRGSPRTYQTCFNGIPKIAFSYKFSRV